MEFLAVRRAIFEAVIDRLSREAMSQGQYDALMDFYGDVAAWARVMDDPPNALLRRIRRTRRTRAFLE